MSGTPNPAEIGDFLALDLRVGTVRAARVHPAARNPALVLEIDFGPELGLRTSSAQLCGSYRPEDLEGRQVVALCNLPPRRVGGVKSEVLVLAGVSETAGTILLEPERPVPDGTRIR